MMEEKVWESIRRQALFAGGGSVIVALSGGADSVALFHFLWQNREKLGIRLAAAHFEHGLRGEESVADAAFVAQWCRALQAELFTESGHMAERERPAGMGAEEWARQLRYAFLTRLAQEKGAVVATAHTASDQAETVLFNAIRGSGTRGLAGIPQKRGPFVRPLLGVSRGEVEEYCAANALAYRTDSTNADTAYSRNRMRADVMPRLERVHPGAEKALCRLACDMRELDGWLCAQAEDVLAAAAAEPCRGAQGPAADARRWQNGQTAARGLNAEILRGAPGPVRRQALALWAGRPAARHTLARMEQVLAGERRAAQLPGGRTLSLRKNRLYLEQTPAPPDEGQACPYEVPLAEGLHAFPGGYRVRAAVLCREDWEKNKKTDAKSYTFAADCDKMCTCSVFRTRREGDVFSPAGRGVTKSLKKWMNEEGVAPACRRRLPLLAQGSRVLWLWGAGFCRQVLPDAQTSRVWVLEVLPAHGKETRA